LRDVKMGNHGPCGQCACIKPARSLFGQRSRARDTALSARRERPEPRNHRSAARSAIEIQETADISATIACAAVTSAITAAAIPILASALADAEAAQSDHDPPPADREPWAIFGVL
jgi:hypothetical protein